MIYSYLKNKKIIYKFDNIRQLKLSASYLKTIDDTVEHFNSKEKIKDMRKYCIENNILFLDVKYGDDYDNYDFAIPHHEKQFILKTFIY